MLEQQEVLFPPISVLLPLFLQEGGGRGAIGHLVVFLLVINAFGLRRCVLPLLLRACFGQFTSCEWNSATALWQKTSTL